MDCHETQERLLETFEGDLSPLEKDQLDRHLAECAECARFAVYRVNLIFDCVKGSLLPN
jgi:predicted anti-sigma-YlaC factor YlaD